MACCFLCFDESPIPGTDRIDNPYTFKTSMARAVIADPCCCLVSLVCPMPTACYNRYLALDKNLEEYKCCQAYYAPARLRPCGWKPGEMGEKSCPHVCMCLEAGCFFTCMVSATRHYLMDKYRIHPDPTDYQIIRCNNALQCLRCICDLAACFIEDLREGARIIDMIAHIVFCTVQGCMQVQTYDEICFQKSKGVTAPVAESMKDRA